MSTPTSSGSVQKGSSSSMLTESSDSAVLPGTPQVALPHLQTGLLPSAPQRPLPSAEQPLHGAGLHACWPGMRAEQTRPAPASVYGVSRQRAASGSPLNRRVQVWPALALGSWMVMNLLSSVLRGGQALPLPVPAEQAGAWMLWWWAAARLLALDRVGPAMQPACLQRAQDACTGARPSGSVHALPEGVHRLAPVDAVLKGAVDEGRGAFGLQLQARIAAVQQQLLVSVACSQRARSDAQLQAQGAATALGCQSCQA